MASIKRLKKDVDYLMYAVIVDSVNHNCLNNQNSNEVSEIITGIISTRNDLRKKINNAGKPENKKETRKFYREIMHEMLKTTDASFTKLSEVISKK